MTYSSSTSGAYWNHFRDGYNYVCNGCGYFKIYHPSETGSLGYLYSPSPSNYIALNFSERNKSTGVMSTEIFSLDDVTYTVTHGF